MGASPRTSGWREAGQVVGGGDALAWSRPWEARDGLNEAGDAGGGLQLAEDSAEGVAAVGGRVPGERLVPAGHEVVGGEGVGLRGAGGGGGRPRLAGRRARPRLGWDFFEETCRCIFDWKERAARRGGDTLRWGGPLHVGRVTTHSPPFFFFA